MDQLETPAEFNSNRSESPDAPDENPPTQKIRSSPARILRTLVIGFAIALSLLAFPSVLPWMIAGWLVVFTINADRGRIAWAPLAICLSVLVIRLVPRTPAMLAMGVLLLLIVVLRFRRGHSATPRTPHSIVAIALLWIAWVAVLWEHHCIQTCARPHFDHFDERSPIVCVGDS
ncbi:MAG: lysophospholipase, partial [Rhodopirellula sp. JB044]